MKKLLFISTCLVLLFAVQASKPLESEFKGTTKREFFNKGSELKIYWEKDGASIATRYVDEKLKTVIRLQGKHTTDFPVVHPRTEGEIPSTDVLTECENVDLLLNSNGGIVLIDNRGVMVFDEVKDISK